MVCRVHQRPSRGAFRVFSRGHCHPLWLAAQEDLTKLATVPLPSRFRLTTGHFNAPSLSLSLSLYQRISSSFPTARRLSESIFAAIRPAPAFITTSLAPIGRRLAAIFFLWFRSDCDTFAYGKRWGFVVEVWSSRTQFHSIMTGFLYRATGLTGLGWVIIGCPGLNWVILSYA